MYNKKENIIIHCAVYLILLSNLPSSRVVVYKKVPFDGSNSQKRTEGAPTNKGQTVPESTVERTLSPSVGVPHVDHSRLVLR